MQKKFIVTNFEFLSKETSSKYLSEIFVTTKFFVVNVGTGIHFEEDKDKKSKISFSCLHPIFNCLFNF